MIDVPPWIQVFVLVGIGVLILVIPLRILFSLMKSSCDRTGRLRDLADRLKDRFGTVTFQRNFLGPHRIHFTCEGRSTVIVQPEPDELLLRLEPETPFGLHAILGTRGYVAWPFRILWESMRVLPRVRTFDPLIDDSIRIYATPVLGNYLRDLALDAVSPDEKPKGLAESLTVLRRTPGIRAFELRLSPSGGFRLHFFLRADDLLYRPDEFEAALHHAFRIYDLFVLR